MFVVPSPSFAPAWTHVRARRRPLTRPTRVYTPGVPDWKPPQEDPLTPTPSPLEHPPSSPPREFVVPREPGISEPPPEVPAPPQIEGDPLRPYEPRPTRDPPPSVSDPETTEALPEALPEAPPSSPGRKPKEGDRASVSARTGGAGRPRSEAGPVPPVAVRRSPARAARRTRAVATRAGVPVETASASRGPLGAVSSQERRGCTRASAVSKVVFARGRASTPGRTTEMALRTCRAGLEGRGAEARSPTGVCRRHREQNKDER